MTDIRMIIPALAALCFACGGDPHAPFLSDVTVSQIDVRQAQEFFVLFQATDRDGDLEDAKVTVQIVGPESSEDVDLETTVDATEIPTGDLSANMSVGLTLTGAFPLGNYQLGVRVIDSAGHESEPVHARINLINGVSIF